MAATTPYDFIQDWTRAHRASHGCGAYTFEDGTGLMALAAKWAPTRVLELGTALGFTACCLASARGTTTVDTIERDPMHVQMARENITEAGLSDRITVYAGDFLQVILSLPGGYDMAFFDGFAPSQRIVSHIHTLLRPAGVIICANVQLAMGADRQDLEREFGGRARWSHLQSLEDGQTQVYRKR